MAGPKYRSSSGGGKHLEGAAGTVSGLEVGYVAGPNKYRSSNGSGRHPKGAVGTFCAWKVGRVQVVFRERYPGKPTWVNLSDLIGTWS